MKKVVLITALFFVVTLCVFANGAKGGGNESIEITQWQFALTSEEGDTAIFNELKEDYAQQYPDVNVNVEFFPWGGRRERMQTALVSGAAPDVAYLNDDMKPLYDGYFLNMNNYLTKEDKDDFTKASIESSSYKGVLCYLPILIDTRAPIYNMDILEAVGIPEEWVDEQHTWDEFMDLLDKVKSAGYTPYTMGPAETSIIDEFTDWIYQAGGSYYNDDMTESTINSPEAVKAFKFMTALWDNGYINRADLDKSQKEIQEAFLDSGVAVFMNANTRINNLKQENPGREVNLKLGYALKDVQIASCGTIAGFGGFSTTKHPEEAAAWIRTLTGIKGMTRIDEAIGFIPPRKSVYDILVQKGTDSTFDRAVENSQWFVPVVPASPVSGSTSAILQSAFQSMILGESTVEDALDQAAADINKLLDTYYSNTK